MNNPFTIGIAEGENFCNREKELEELMSYARNRQKVVFYSPRRFGKSSLILKVLKNLSKENFLVVYADLFSVTSESDFLSKFAMAIVKGLGNGSNPKNWMQKVAHIFKKIIPVIEMGQEGPVFSVKFDRSDNQDLLLEDLMEGIGNYAKKKNKKICIALDEFQEITELKQSKRIEGILRSYIQRQNEIAYFFIGSRRRVLIDMFSDKGRPFYKSAFMYTFSEIKEESFIPYISDFFNRTSKICTKAIAKEIYNLVEGHPYYVQKLSSISWDNTKKNCDSEIVKNSWNQLLKIETPEFEGIWSGLSLGQRTLIKAISKDNPVAIFSKDYLYKNNLSVGGVQKALKYLLHKDIIEKKKGLYTLTDPVFREWLKNQ